MGRGSRWWSGLRWPAAALLAACAGVARPGIACAGPAALALSECRLEHPLHLNSVAANCGILQVPLDRDHASESIALHVAVVPALNRRSAAAPLFLVAGGPGQGTASMYTALAGAFARINRDHDIVLVDQRGTGGSNPQICDYPEDWREPPDPLPALRQATVACLAKLGLKVRFYTTSAAVRDLEAVRVALGYEHIDLYAASYGTRVAQHYMRRYPAHTHAVILDGVTYPEQALGWDTPLDAEHALELIVARCLKSPDCAHAYPRLPQELGELRERFGSQRLAITIADPNDAQPLSIEFTRGMLAAALRFLSYSSAQAALIPTLVHEAAGSALGALAAQTVMSARQIGDQLASGMQYSVICTEDFPFYDAASHRAALAKTYQGTDQWDALREICGLWPRGPLDADLHAALASAIPTLLLSGEADPVTPPADAERAASGLTHHRHLVLAGEGHGQLGIACVPRLMAQFLDGAAPLDLDATCLAQHAPAAFFVGMTGPSP
jgi:pimeloyl-ACP methyl ester carboxylesterase